jgi:lipoate-protein ligase A
VTGTLLAVRLPHRVARGDRQMSLDAGLLAWATEAPARVALRTYGWSRPTLSLGRAEPFPDGWDAARLEAEGIDVARRPSGGDAVLHVEELTFAVAASLPGPWELTPRSFADAVAGAVAEAVSRGGVAASVVGGEAGASVRDHALVCFARTSRGEVRSGAYKIAGLASCFGRGGALCHGSIPLGRGYRNVLRYRLRGDRERTLMERHARSLGELVPGPPPQAARLADGLADALGARLGVAWESAAFARLGLEEP